MEGWCSRRLAFHTAELRVNCGLVDHASMLFERGGSVKRARLWTPAKLKARKDFLEQTVWSPAAGALTFTRPARIRFVEFLRMRCQLADDEFLKNIGGGGATDADERVCERQANSAILSRVVKI